jgi:hypothetical protein
MMLASIDEAQPSLSNNRQGGETTPRSRRLTFLYPQEM